MINDGQPDHSNTSVMLETRSNAAMPSWWTRILVVQKYRRHGERGNVPQAAKKPLMFPSIDPGSRAFTKKISVTVFQISTLVVTAPSN